MNDAARAILASIGDLRAESALLLDLAEPEIEAAFDRVDLRVADLMIVPERDLRPLRPPDGLPLPWAPGDPVEIAIVATPKSRRRLRMLLRLAASRLAPGGRLVIAAPNRGAGGAQRELAELGEVRRVAAKAHHRIAEVRIDDPRPFRLDDWRTEGEVATPDGPLRCVWYPGVFAEGRLDEGTALLLDHLPRTGDHAMDLGTGCGILLAFLARRGFNACGFDADAFAMHASGETVRVNGLGSSLAWSTSPDGHPLGDDLCDLIVTNPSFHEGLRTTTSGTERLLTEARRFLARDGTLLLVANRFLRYDRVLDAAGFATIEAIAEDARYRVWRAK